MASHDQTDCVSRFRRAHLIFLLVHPFAKNFTRVAQHVLIITIGQWLRIVTPME
jgi:hypothetical protein